jgi:hypothetical protein
VRTSLPSLLVYVMYIIVYTTTEQYNFQLLIHSMIDRRVNDGIRKFVAHIHYMLMVCINDCTDRYSYACMHVGDSDPTNIVGGIYIYISQCIAHHRVSVKDREIAHGREDSHYCMPRNQI